MNPAHGNEPPVIFTIDGVEYTTNDRRQAARDLLVLAGMDPDEHDLGQVHGHANLKRFADDDQVQITPGARFVTLFTGATPVA